MWRWLPILFDHCRYRHCRTLTLPGIAGIVLTIMAVDANVLIFERIREELARGRSVLAAIDGVYQRARFNHC